MSEPARPFTLAGLEPGAGPVTAGAPATAAAPPAAPSRSDIWAAGPRLRPPRRLPRWLGRPVVQALLAFALYLAVFIAVFARPVVAHLGVPQVDQYWTDPNFYTWALRWWPYAVSHWTNPLYSTQIGAPAGYDLAWATTAPAVSLLMWPVTAALGAVASFNIMLLLVPPACGLAAFVMAHRLTGRFLAALAAGAVYGFSPFELWHSLQGQPNLTMTALLPLVVYLVTRWWQGALRWPWFTGWLAVVMALQFYTFNEAFAGLTVIGAGALLIGYAVAGRAARPKVLRLAGLATAGYAGAVVLALPYLSYALRHYPAALTRQLPIFSLSPVRLVLPSSDRLFGLTGLIGYSNNAGRYSIDDYVGIPLLAVLLALAVFAWRSRLARLLAATFVLTIALALGPGVAFHGHQVFPLPWGELWSLPIARSAEPSRLIVFAVLLLAIALALWLGAPRTAAIPGPDSSPELDPAPGPDHVNGPDHVSGPVRPRGLSRVPRTARWALGLLAVAVMFADLPTFAQAVSPVPASYRVPARMHPVNRLPEFLTHGLYRRHLSPGETVVVVTHRGNAGMLFQAEANFYFKIAGGFINSSLTRQDALPLPVARLSHATKDRERAFAAYVRANHVGAILVERAWAEPWMSIFARMGMQPTEAGGVIVYPVAPWLGSPAERRALAS